MAPTRRTSQDEVAARMRDLRWVVRRSFGEGNGVRTEYAHPHDSHLRIAVVYDSRGRVRHIPYSFPAVATPATGIAYVRAFADKVRGK